MKIGFFDSGIGGLTVLAQALKRFPQYDYVYYADTMHAPYGKKPKEEVRGYIAEAVEFLVSQQVDAIVIACNTATSVAVSDLRASYDIPIIGIEPAVKPAIELEHDRQRVLVTATPLTIKEEKLHQLIERLGATEHVDLVALPELVKFAERYDFSDETVLPYLEKALVNYEKSAYKAVVLGCTQFPLFKPQYQTIFCSNVALIDGSDGKINQLQKILGLTSSTSKTKPKGTYYQTKKQVDRETAARYDALMAHI